MRLENWSFNITDDIIPSQHNNYVDVLVKEEFLQLVTVKSLIR